MRRFRAARRRTACPSACPDDGFTLVELLVAMAIFLVVSAATLGLILKALDAIQGNRNRVYAAALARTQLDSMRALGTSSIPLGAVTETVNSSSGAAYTVTRTATWVNLGLATNPCSVGPGVKPGKSYMRVEVAVTSRELGAPQKAISILYPQATPATDNTGTITVAVNDDLGQPVAGVSVSGTSSGGTFSQTTGPDGCIFVPDLAIGSWSVTVSKTGYITQTPTGATQTGVVVSELTNTPITFTYAASGTLTFTAGTNAYPVPAGMPFTFSPNTLNKAPASYASYPNSVSGLWPTAYTGWLRACLTAATGSSGSATLSAGGTSTLALGGTKVQMVGPAGATVTAVAAGCSGSTGTYTLGTIPDSLLLQATLPAGSWTLTASGASPASKTATIATNTTLCSVSWNVPGAVAAGSTPSPTSTPTSTATATPSPTASTVFLPEVSSPCPS